MPTRFGGLRPISLVVLALAMTACGSSGGTQAPGGTGSAGVVAAASAAGGSPGAGHSTGPGLTPAAPSGGSSTCPAGLTSGHAKYVLSGFEAWHFCGPATATVTLGSTTVNITSGFCDTPAAGMFSVSIGTQLFGDPPESVSPDYLNILIVAADGKTDPGGMVGHKRWLLVGATITFAADRHSGSFSGAAIGSGTAVHGSFICG